MNFILKILIVIFFIIEVNTLLSQESKKIDIIQASALEFDEEIAEGSKRLIGDVVFHHDGIYMFCDSAHFFDEQNIAIAYNNVRIKQGDSILIVGQYLEYDGDTKLVKMRDSVTLKHNHSYLLTNFLDYNRIDEIGYYFKGGTIYDGNNILTSRRGYYYTNDKDYYAVDSVKLVNPDYVITSDTMKYGTETGIAYFFGKTEIISDSNYIYCENGFYDTQENIASFSKNSYLVSGSYFLKGDSLYYDRKIKFGEGFHNVSIVDTAESVMALGNYGYFYESPEYAFITEQAQLIYFKDNDSIFLHSDTVIMNTDSLDFKLIRAFRKVQIFKSDAQARCDSLTFYLKDSIARLYYEPIIWAENNKQLSAKHIYIQFKEKKPESFYLEENAFVIENIDSIYYSQAKSDKMIGYIKDDELREVNMYKNSQTIYYITDDDTEEVIGYNRLFCVDMTLELENKKLKGLWVYDKPEAIFMSIEQLTDEDFFLRDFLWLDNYRPKTKYDIFDWKNIEK